MGRNKPANDLLEHAFLVSQDNIFLEQNPAAELFEDSGANLDSGTHLVARSDAYGRVRIAGILDEFSEACFAPECDYLALDPMQFESQIADFAPDLLLVESAWNGSGGAWARLTDKARPELSALVALCQAQRIPTVFWNKEDPVHFSRFLGIAQMFDHVFTTDADCIPAYKAAIGHDRVHLLPFAAQPRLHNPFMPGRRKDKFVFAGSYYQRFPQRRRDFGRMVDAVSSWKDVEIYDRHQGKNRAMNRFPRRFEGMIVGQVPYAQIPQVYKGYKFALNMNSAKQSQTMVARRVFELLASNTVVVSNYSRATRNIFGDTVICTDNRAYLLQRLKSCCQDDLTYRKFRLQGLRQVMSRHCYAHRVATLLALTLGRDASPAEARILLVAHARNQVEADRVIWSFSRQVHDNRELLLLTAFPCRDVEDPRIRICSDEARMIDHVLRERQNVDFIGMLHPDDHYGPHYLTDLALSRAYTNADAVGKFCRFEADADGHPRYLHPDRAYRGVRGLPLRASLISGQHISRDLIRRLLNLYEDDQLVEAGWKMLALDEFNYCKNGFGLPQVAQQVDDLQISFTGLATKAMSSFVADAPPAPRIPCSHRRELVGTAEMAADMADTAHLSARQSDQHLVIHSTLSQDRKEVIWMSRHYRRRELNLLNQNGVEIRLQHDVRAASVLCEMTTSAGTPISTFGLRSSGKHFLPIPEECENIRFGVKVAGPGQVTLGDIVMSEDEYEPAEILLQSDRLVVAESFSAYGNRKSGRSLSLIVEEAHRQGQKFDIFLHGNKVIFSEFEGIDIIHGDDRLLESALRNIGPQGHVISYAPDCHDALKNLGDDDVSVILAEDETRLLEALKIARTPAVPTPRVSVVIPVFGVEKFIADAINSVRTQTLHELEIIAVIDGPSDASPEIVATLAQIDARIVSITLPQNVGQGFARNAGLEAARGDYIWFLDGDDLMPDPGFLAAAVEHADAHELDMVRGRKELFRGKHVAEAPVLDRLEDLFPPDQHQCIMGQKQALQSWNCWLWLYRRDYLNRRHIRFALPKMEERPFVIEAVSGTMAISGLDRVAVAYRRHNTSTMRGGKSLADVEMFLTNIRLCLATLEKNISETGSKSLTDLLMTQVLHAFFLGWPWPVLLALPAERRRDILGRFARILEATGFDEDALSPSWPLIKAEDRENRIHQRIVTSLRSRQFDEVEGLLKMRQTGQGSMSAQ